MFSRNLTSKNIAFLFHIPKGTLSFSLVNAQMFCALYLFDEMTLLKVFSVKPFGQWVSPFRALFSTHIVGDQPILVSPYLLIFIETPFVYGNFKIMGCFWDFLLS